VGKCGKNGVGELLMEPMRLFESNSVLSTDLTGWKLPRGETVWVLLDVSSNLEKMVMTERRVRHLPISTQ
jgi:hypothetical protein